MKHPAAGSALFLKRAIVLIMTSSPPIGIVYFLRESVIAHGPAARVRKRKKSV
jgi:hypothetical protein